MAKQLTEEYGARRFTDYLALIGIGGYATASLAFLAGLYFDLQRPGAKVISQLAIADEPHANSGLFILSFILLLIGYLFSRMSDLIEARGVEEVEESQEWTVDIKSD